MLVNYNGCRVVAGSTLVSFIVYSVGVLFDWSDQPCFSDWYEQYLVAIETLVEEQLASRDGVYMIPLGSQISNPVLHNMRNKGYEQHLVFDSISFHFPPPSPPSSLSGV